MPETDDAAALWKAVNAELHKGDLIPSLWEAAARAQPITVDGDTLVLGLAASEIGLRSHLEAPPNMARLRHILRAVAERDMTLRVIEGLTVEAWEATRAREQEREALRGEEAQRRFVARAELAGWEQLRDHLTKLFAERASRRSPQLLAAYLMDVLPLVKHTYETVKQSGKVTQEANERQLSRVLDKIAAQCNVPVTCVALELQRLEGASQS
ncbi:MAG: hypothetical protein ACE5O2_14365 [Armatimonadota bacterium]